jgi:hypothetical protein
MKPTMTVELARAAATDAGRRNAVRNGRPPAPWTRDDLDAATHEFHRICREFKIGMYGNTPMLPKNDETP